MTETLKKLTFWQGDTKTLLHIQIHVHWIRSNKYLAEKLQLQNNISFCQGHLCLPDKSKKTSYSLLFTNLLF